MSEMQMYEITIDNKTWYLAKDIYEAGKNPCLCLVSKEGKREDKLTVNLGFQIANNQVAFKSTIRLSVLQALLDNDIIAQPRTRIDYGIGHVYVYNLTLKGMSL